MHILNNTIDEINCSEAYQLIEKSFIAIPLTQCKRMCSDPINYDKSISSSNAKFNWRNLINEDFNIWWLALKWQNYTSEAFR